MNASPARSAGVLAPVTSESTPSMIASRLREAIATGAIPQGSQIGEADFARQLKVSRGPLREGLQRLVQEGLVRAVRNRGHFVVELSREDIQDLFLARAAIERAAARQLYQGDRMAVRTELLAAVEAMRQAAAAEDAPGVSYADIDFHRILVRGAQSPRLRRTHETLMTETRMCIHALEPTYPQIDQRVKEHLDIAESLCEDDSSTTDRLLAEHMDDALRRLGASTEGLPSA